VEKRIFGTAFIDYLPALGLAIFTAIFLAAARGYPSQARAFPDAIGWVTMVLIALDLVSRTGTRPGVEVRKRLNPGRAIAEVSHPLSEQILASLRVALFAIALILLGVLTAVLLFVFASLRFRGGRSWLTSAWVSLAVTAGVWFLFAVLLRLELHPGYFFGGS
jgi:hypothetical protein